jgi:hypothetical protein
MKVLLDENLPHRLRPLIKGHDVYTVGYLGWSGTVNGALLKRAAEEGFAAMLTMDNGVPYEQNLAALPLAVIVLRAPSNNILHLTPLVPQIHSVLAAVTGPGIHHIHSS